MAALSDQPTGDFLPQLAQTNDAAAAALFIDLCRTSPTLRGWLWGKFAKSEKTRTELARVLDSGQLVSDPISLLANLANEPAAGAAREWATLKRDMAAKVRGPRYGGLTRRQVETLTCPWPLGHGKRSTPHLEDGPHPACGQLCWRQSAVRLTGSI